MKSLLIGLVAFSSFSALGAISELSFKRHEVQEKAISLHKPLPVNLIKIYRKIDFEKRMIAGFQATRNEIPEKKSWINGLRSRLEGTGQLRL